MERDVIWRAVLWEGLEHVAVQFLDGGRLVADSLLVAVLDGAPHRYWYRIMTAEDGTTNRLTIHRSIHDADRKTLPLDLTEPALDLTRRDDGSWQRAGHGELPALVGCHEVDIILTPFTNTLPIRRLGLDVGEAAEIRALYVMLPQLELTAQRQRYTRLAPDRYRYEGLDTGYVNEIGVDPDGLVLDYPGLWERTWPV